MSAAEALDLVSKLACIGIAVSTLELAFLYGRGEFSRGGVWDWRVIRSSGSFESEWLDTVFQQKHAIAALLLARMFSVALVLWYSLGTMPHLLGVSGLLLCQLLLNLRLVWGDDGSDQMTSIVLVSVWLGSLFVRTTAMADLAVAFIAIQLTLAYFISGLAKIFGRDWRAGRAFRMIMGHYGYGNPEIYKFLARYENIAIAMNYIVIVFQLSFPVYYFVPFPLAYIFLAKGLIFHFGIACIMRLNGFLFAFGAGYPALYYFHYEWPRTVQIVLEIVGL